MKPFLSLGVLLSLFLTLSCRHCPATVVQDCYHCDTDAFYGLTAEDYREGLQRYRRERADVIDDSVLKGIKSDARSCWYSIDTLKKFICLMEKYASRLHIPADSLGIRFHYAVYPGVFPQNPEYSRLHTIFMVATCRSNEVNRDFDPRYLDSLYGPQPPGLDSLLQAGDPRFLPPGVRLFELDYVSANHSDATGTSVMAKNQGQLCPNYPNCPTD
jgi:hypothetical protein